MGIQYGFEEINDELIEFKIGDEDELGNHQGGHY